MMLKAAELKAVYPLSLADAWIAACAHEQSAMLLHKDPKFNALPLAQEILTLARSRWGGIMPLMETASPIQGKAKKENPKY